MILNTAMIKQGWANGKAIFLSQPLLTAKIDRSGLEVVGIKKPPQAAGLKNLYIILSEK
jgi:hypothetical protein